jgi:hypothetical protein
MNYARRLARRAASRFSAASKSRAAIKDQRRRGFFAERLEDRSLMAADALSAFHNYSNPADVDGDYNVSAQDVLAIINSINAKGSRQLPTDGSQGEATTLMVDADNDGFVTATDVVTVINFINAHAGGEAGNPNNKATYTLEVLDANGNALTDHDDTDPTLTETASVKAGSDFYIQLIAQDIRNAGKDPVTNQNLARGVFSAYTDILYDTTLGTPAVNEIQSIAFDNTSGTFTLNVPAKGTFTGATTGSIAYSANTATTAGNIQSALNTALAPKTGNPNSTLVTFDATNTVYNVTFLGINNIDLDNMVPAGTSASHVSVSELSSGDPTNILGAVTYEPDASGLPRYDTDHSAGLVAAYGINDVGGFTSSTKAIGRGATPVFRIHMISNTAAPGSPAQTLVFTPDPLGDGSGSTQDMLRPKHNTLVFGNDNVTDGGGNTVELEKSLVTFGDPVVGSTSQNEFAALNPVTVSLTTGPIQAKADSLNFNEDDPSAANRTVDVLANDITSPAGQTLQILSFTQPATGGTVTAVGGATPTTNGQFLFAPTANFAGTTTFTYKVGIVGDANTDDQVTQTVTVTVAPVNDAPVLVVPGAQTATEDTAKAITGITVSDVDAGAAGVSVTLAAGHGNLTVTAAGAAQVTNNNSGSVTIAGTTADVTTTLASLSYLPTLNYNGGDSLSVNVTDNGNTGQGNVLTASGSVAITVNAVNDAPVNLIGGADANGQHVVAVPNSTNTPLAGFNVTDVDLGETANAKLTVTLTPGAGTLSATASGGGTVQGGGTTASPLVISGSQAGVTATLATLAYTPVLGSTTATTLLFVSTDGGATGSGGAQTTTSNVSIDLDPGYRPGPIADTKPIDEGTAGPVTIDVLANDFKRAAPTVTTITDVTQPAQGTITNNGTSLSYAMPADPNFFTPAGPLTFTYTVADDFTGDDGHPNCTGSQCVATVSINIKNVPDAPVATAGDGPYGAAFDSSANVQTPLVVTAANGVLSNDTDVDNNYGVSNYATLKAVVDTSTHRGTLVLNADGSFSYTPAAGTGDDSFTYHVNAVTPESGAAGVNSNTVTVNIHVTTPPTATNDHFNVLEQGNPATSGNVLTGAGSSPASAADSDDSDHQSLTAVNLVQLQNPTLVGTVALNPDGSFSYTPPTGQNFNTTRPAVPDISFTYQAKTTDGRLSHVATVTLTVQEVNDPPTATDDDHTFLAVKNNGSGTVGVHQEVTVLTNDSISPDVSLDATGHVVTTGGDEFLSVSGISSTNGGFGTTNVTTGAGGTVHLENGKIFYDSPSNGFTGEDSFYYQISDNSSASRNGGGPLFASAKVSFSVVDFVPKTVSGTVYVDGNGDGLIGTGEKALAGVTVHLDGTAFDGSAVALTTTTDASGHYTFPAVGSGFTLKPPNASGYTLTEEQPLFMLNGMDTDLSTNTSGGVHLVTNLDRLDNAFLLAWAITDQSGNIAGLNFGEGGTAGLINTDPNNGGLYNASGFKSELLASTGKNGFIAAVDMSGNIVWSWTIEGDTGAWAGHTLTGALLSNDLSSLDVEVDGGLDVTLTQGYLSSTSTARFRLLGAGLDSSGQQMYIIRIDGSYDGSPGTFNNSTGVSDGMFLTSNLQGAQGEAPVEGNYADSADAVFAEQAWA